MGLKKDIGIGILATILLLTSVIDTCTIEYYCSENGMHRYIYSEKVTLLGFIIKSNEFFEDGKILIGDCGISRIKIE